MAHGKDPIWEGISSAKLIGTAPDKVWPLLEDFCSFNKWLPTIDTCYKVDGDYGQPGLVRYCGSTVPVDGQDKAKKITWCHEKLLAIDHVERSLSYEIVDNNMGLKSYKATLQVMEIMDGPDHHEEGCEIVWRFVSDPVEGGTVEDLVAYLESALHGMVERMDQAFKSFDQ